MRTLDDDDLIRRLHDAGTVAPDPAAAARAIAQTRAALLGASEQKPLLRRRLTMLTRIAAALVLVAGLAVLAGWLLLGGGPAFAEVQEKVARARTLTFQMIRHEAGKEVERERVFLLAPNLLRTEAKDGKVVVTDYQQRRVMFLDPARKHARVIQGLALEMPNLYELIRNAPKDAVRRLADEKLDGKKMTCFLVPFGAGAARREAKVWVDPATRLPVQLEFAGKDEKGKDVREVAAGLTFDAELDKTLFALTPPEGYRVETVGQAELPPAPKEADRAAPEAKPGIGLGPIRFGMSREEVIAALGQPDSEESRGAMLHYPSRGYFLVIRPKHGLYVISCVSQAAFATKVRDFAGKTPEGVGIGSSQKDLEKAYGKPDEVEENGPETKYVRYQAKRLDFTLFHDKVVQFTLSAP